MLALSIALSALLAGSNTTAGHCHDEGPTHGTGATLLPQESLLATDSNDYGVVWQEGDSTLGTVSGWKATNSPRYLQASFTPDGLRVRPILDGRDWQWGLQLEAFGRGEQLQSVDQPELRVLGNRVEYVRCDLVEWYVNDERGLEQGFTLARAPNRTRTNP